MQFGYKLASSQQEIVNNLIDFKLIISNVIKTKQVP